MKVFLYILNFQEEMIMRKLAGMFLALTMTASLLAGCGGSGQTADSGAATDTAAEGSVFKIGGIGPTSGGAAVYGLAVQRGAQIAVDEINANGGINGYQIEYKFADDEHDAEKSVNAYNDLKDWGMQVLMGTTTSGPCVAVVEKTNEDNMYQLTPSGTSVDAIKYPNAYRVCFSDPGQGTKSAQYIGENKIASKVAVIYDSSDVYSSGIYNNFREAAEGYGIEIVAAESFTSDNKTDFTIQLQKAKEGGAELVFLPIYYSEAALILSQADTMGFAPLFFGCDGLDGILSVEKFDTSLAEGVMFLTPFAADATDELTQSFVSAYQEAHGEVPIQFAANAYDAIYIIKEAIENAGATPDMSVSDICEAMKTAMSEIAVTGLTGTDMTWTEDGEVNKEPKAVKIVDGAYVAM